MDDQEHHSQTSDMVRDRQALLDRLKKIEGQVRGLHNMIEVDRYCVDVLIQVAAVRAALNQVGLALFEGHARGCMAAATRRGEGDAAANEFMAVLKQFLR